MAVTAGGSSTELADWLAGCGARLTGPPEAVAGPGPLLRAVLGAALERLPAGERERVPVVLAADEPCVRAATHYGRRWTDTARRLRPSDSVALETSELVRGLGEELGWSGALYLLAAPGEAGRQALLAAGFVGGGGPVLVAELVTAAGPRAEDVPAPEWLAVAALRPPRAKDAGSPPQAKDAADPRKRPPGVLLALAGARGPAPAAVPNPDPEEPR